MADFRDRILGDTYTGPTKQKVYEFITMFDLRKGCTRTDVIKQYGHRWSPMAFDHISQLEVEGKLIVGKDFIGKG